MKIRIYLKIVVPAGLEKDYDMKEIPLIIIIESDTSMLPFFCPGSVHTIGLQFDENNNLHGDGCNTMINLEIQKPYTRWIDGKPYICRLDAKDIHPTNPKIDNFRLFLNALLLSTNVYVVNHPFCVEGVAREVNSQKVHFIREVF